MLSHSPSTPASATKGAEAGEQLPVHGRARLDRSTAQLRLALHIPVRSPSRQRAGGEGAAGSGTAAQITPDARMMATVINVCGGAGDVERARRYLDRLLAPAMAPCVPALSSHFGVKW